MRSRDIGDVSHGKTAGIDFEIIISRFNQDIISYKLSKYQILEKSDEEVDVKTKFSSVCTGASEVSRKKHSFHSDKTKSTLEVQENPFQAKLRKHLNSL
jgi:hypothetical protein